MSKIIFNGNGIANIINVHNMNQPGCTNLTLAIGANMAFNTANGGTMNIIPNGAIEIELQNGTILAINECTAPVTCSVFDGKLTLNDMLHAPAKIGMWPNTQLNVIHNGHNYQFNNPDNNGAVCFANLNKFIIVCETVNSFFAGGTTPSIGTNLSLEQVCFLRVFQQLIVEQNDLLKEFMHQNGMINPIIVKTFICDNFFELDAIAHSLEGSGLLNSTLGHYDPIFEICSYLKLDDVDITGHDQNENDHAI